MNRIVLSVCLAVVALASCKSPQAPEYLGFRDMQFGKVDMRQTDVTAQLAFYNMNDFSMQLRRADIDVFLNDKLANHYAMDTLIEIPKKDTFLVPIVLHLNPKDLLGNALQIVLNDNKVKFRLEGSVRIRRSGIGFTVPVHYEDMQKIEISL